MKKTQNDFHYDQKLFVYRPKDTPNETFAYADGTEEALLKKIHRTGDISSYSTEFLPYADWAEEYHLSPYRQQVLSPFAALLKDGTRVLELGGGCGAISRALGERGCDVTSVEGSLTRTKVLAARCRDLKNVKTYNANFQDIFFGKIFDVVTLIGVLEYAPLYFSGTDPVGDCLRLATNHLAESGTLLVAIENKIGLKYLGGIPEDHLGIPYFGISELYNIGGKTVVTFSKNELIALIKKSGLDFFDFYYPFPDYKMASCIFSENAFSEDFSPHQIVAGIPNTFSGQEAKTNFYMPGLMAALEREGIASNFSNSFVLAAAKNPLPPASWIASYATIRENRKFSATTRFIRSQHNIVAAKEPLFPELLTKTDCLHFQPTTSPYIAGESLYFRATKLLLTPTPESWSGFESLMVSYVCFLSGLSSDGLTLSGKFIDTTPKNIIIAEDGSFNIIDHEWIFSKNIHITTIACRGIASSLSSVEKKYWINYCRHKNIAEFIKHIINRSNIKINRCFIEDSIQIERDLQKIIRPEKIFDDNALRTSLTSSIPFIRYKIRVYPYILIFKKIFTFPFKRLRRILFFHLAT